MMAVILVGQRWSWRTWQQSSSGLSLRLGSATVRAMASAANFVCALLQLLQSSAAQLQHSRLALTMLHSHGKGLLVVSRLCGWKR
jgi:H+/gluconate symporter-like permease